MYVPSSSIWVLKFVYVRWGENRGEDDGNLGRLSWAAGCHSSTRTASCVSPRVRQTSGRGANRRKGDDGRSVLKASHSVPLFLFTSSFSSFVSF